MQEDQGTRLLKGGGIKGRERWRGGWREGWWKRKKETLSVLQEKRKKREAALMGLEWSF